MFKLFRRRKVRPEIKFEAFQKLGEVVVRRQKKVAALLNRKTREYSKRTWIWLLSGFCLVFGGAAIEVGLNSMGMASPDRGLRPAHIAVPRLIYESQMMDSIAAFEAWRRKHLETIKNEKHGKASK